MKSHPFWNEGNPSTLDCKYICETEFEGLHVYIFEMSTPDEGLTTPAGFVIPDLKAYQPAMPVDQNIRMYVEPVSGVTVYFESTTKRSGTIPVQDELYPVTGPVTNKTVTFYEDNLTFTDRTVRQDYVTVDRNLTPPGKELRNLLAPDQKFTVADRGPEGARRSAVHLPLAGHEMIILRATDSS